MQLHHTDLGGNGPPLVILHGLFGSSKNWTSMGRLLQKHAHVYLLDLRNHGDSPHMNSHTLKDLIEDLQSWLQTNLTEPPFILGHSMGGMNAMGFALDHPKKLRGLIVADIAPRSYPRGHDAEFQALRMDLSRFRSRQEIDAAMSAVLPDPGVRQFLQMNLKRTQNGYHWRLNVDVLEKSHYKADFSTFQPASFFGPTLFVRGGQSPYITDADLSQIKQFFPAAQIEMLAKADHWMHFTSEQEFYTLVANFLNV